MTFNSTLKPGKPLQRKTPLQATKPMQRNREKKGKGLAQRIAESLGRAIGAPVFVAAAALIVLIIKGWGR